MQQDVADTISRETSVYNVEDDVAYIICQETRVYNAEDDVSGIIRPALATGSPLR